MRTTTDGARVLQDRPIPVQLKLSAAWAALMFLYAYGDVFAFFRPGFVEDVMRGEVDAFEIDQVFLVAISIYVAVPALMVFLSLVLRPTLNRRANAALGVIYAVTIVGAAVGEDYAYYYLLSLLETALALLIAWYAWKWPEQPAG